MKLHGNAALSWSGRQRLVERVVTEGWTLRAAAASAEVSVRCARKWVSRYRRAGEHGLFDRSSAPRRVWNRTPSERIEVIVALRRLRMTAAEIAEVLGMALSTVSGILTQLGMGKLGRLGLEPALRYERSRAGELVHVDVKKLGRIVGGAGWRVRGGPQHYNPKFTDPAGRVRAHGGLGVRAHRDRRLQPPRLRRGARRREGTNSDRLPTPRACLLQALRRHRRACAHRQRRRLPLDHPRSGLSSAGNQAPAHPAIPAADERQSRTLHPHAAGRLGPRSDLPLERRTDSSP